MTDKFFRPPPSEASEEIESSSSSGEEEVREGVNTNEHEMEQTIEERDDTDDETEVTKKRKMSRPSDAGPPSKKHATAASFFEMEAEGSNDDDEDCADIDDNKQAFVAPTATQQGLVPSVLDPLFWMVACPSGKEQELAFQIMNKCMAHARQRRPIGISAVIVGQSKGTIYVESFNERAVKEAICGIRGLSQNKMRIVPLNNMTTVSKCCTPVIAGRYI